MAARPFLVILLSAAASRLGSPKRAGLRLVIPGLAIVLVASAVVASGAIAFLLLFPRVPIPPTRPGAVARTTHVYAADGRLIARWHGEVDRVPIPLSRIPRHVQEAAVAAEDARFFSHPALDSRSILRALLVNLRGESRLEGGSTITQQYVKLAYVGGTRSFVRKLREARLAYQLERTTTKREILERYLNTVYFGRGAYGLQAAAHAYFGKPAADLSVSEAALLAGMIAGPRRYSPDLHPVQAELRRQWVIERMRRVGFLAPDGAEAAQRDRPTVVPPGGQAAARYAWFLDAVRIYLYQRYGEQRVLTGGLEVHTTLEPAMQEAAERVVREQFPDAWDPHAALVSIEPATGYVRAIVGGRGGGEEKFNIALLGRRQPGSAFKPIVLAAALESGISPEDRFSGATLHEATVRSLNASYSALVRSVGPKRVVEVAERMGIPGPSWLPADPGCPPDRARRCRTSIEPVPALALGSEEVTPIELASAFATLGADGVYREPRPVATVRDGDGKVLEGGPAEPRQAISPQTARAATAILEQAVARGTGRRAAIHLTAAGKTGTAEEYRNAWFAGYTPRLATAVWVGYRDSNLPLLDVRGVSRVEGGTIPAAMWAAYMNLVFPPPEPVVSEADGASEDRAAGRARSPRDRTRRSEPAPDLPAVPLVPVPEEAGPGAEPPAGGGEQPALTPPPARRCLILLCPPPAPGAG